MDLGSTEIVCPWYEAYALTTEITMFNINILTIFKNQPERSKCGIKLKE